MLTSCWQVLSEVVLRRIFDVYERWANSGFACFCKEKYGQIYEATRAIRSLLVWKFSTYTLDLGLSSSNARSCCIFTLAVRETPFWPLVLKYILFFVWNHYGYGIMINYVFYFFDKLTLKNHTKIHFTADDYMIIFVLCSIWFNIRNLKNWFCRILFSMIISWFVLFFTRVMVQLPRDTIKRQ